ncbi:MULTISPECIES: hypothetical protein [Streptomyces]|uniref:Phage tail protein n=1 Tax=Streptomyces nymphaeiformis TaxID=2663842 RepID=A0A7W7U895_9ACTN|nr:hypothetical protein [Streptomyces nymphaeiformis]MBB4986724.1 hypothetical protein [Streptomyces nymphaeiformis]
MTTPQPEPTAADRLYALLPEVYRLRDAERGGVLREFVEVLATQLAVLEEDLEQLYDDQFIETCAPWVAPYIGDLIGYRPLHGVADKVRSPRAEVAHTMAYRRRKGTAAVVEQLARDVTGWPARAVEFFERLVTTQYMNHTRLHARATPTMRDQEALSWGTLMNGAFDDLAHTADVRAIAPRPSRRAGRYGIPNVGIFLWRTVAVRLDRTPLTPHAPGDGRRFRIDTLGSDARLFGAPRTEEEITHLAEPEDVPLPLTRRRLAARLDASYGSERDLLLSKGVRNATGAWEFTPVRAADITVCDLSDLPDGSGAWAHEPAAGKVAVDPELGRVFFGTAVPGTTKPVATHHYGLAVPLAARGSARGEAATPLPLPHRKVADGEAQQAVLDGLAGGGTLRITDSDRYEDLRTVRTTTAAAGGSDTVVWVRAEDGVRPTLAVPGGLRLAMAPRTTVVLDGLLVTGGPVVLEEQGDGGNRTVELNDCTLVPGQSRTEAGQPAHPERASLLILDPFATVRLNRCVLGPIVAVEGADITLTDCVVDASAPKAVAFCGRPEPADGGPHTVPDEAAQATGDGAVPGGRLHLRECTVIGGIHADVLDASNSLLVAVRAPGDVREAAVWARRRQEGCLRFSYVPEDSRTGRRYRCRPDPADPPGTRRADRPHFTSLRFGDPAYAQLGTATPDTVRRGADDESEMGATHLLFTPRRESDLLLRLDEYLRFGLEAGFFYAT